MPKLSRIRALPWFLIVQAGLAANAHWSKLPPGDRERLTQLLRRSRGRPGNLSAREREEVRLLLGQLDAPGLARDLVPFLVKGRGRGRGRR